MTTSGKPRVLLTGANGLIGRFAMPLLVQAGYEVHAVSRGASPVACEGVVWHQLDLMDTEATGRLLQAIKAESLLHLAWYTEHGKFWTAAENLDWVQASLVLLKSFVEQGGRRCVLAGSCAEYSWNEGHCIEGQTPCKPSTLYGTSKLALQQVAQAYCDLHKVSMAWGRVFFLYGPHEPASRYVPLLIDGMLDKRTIPCSSGRQLRDFMYVADVASAFVSLLGSDCRGCVNIASGQAMSLKDIALKVADQLDGHALLQFGSLPDRPGDPLVLTADVTRLQAEVGWRPRYSLEEGLKETIASRVRSRA